MSYTSRIYSEDPSLTTSSRSSSSSSSKRKPATPLAPNSTVTALQARTFGTWTLVQSLVRLYAAYHIGERAFYEMGLATYAIAWVHFMAEWFVFRTVKWGAPLAGPVVVSSGTIVWMWLQWGYYVQ